MTGTCLKKQNSLQSMSWVSPIWDPHQSPSPSLLLVPCYEETVSWMRTKTPLVRGQPTRLITCMPRWAPELSSIKMKLKTPFCELSCNRNVHKDILLHEHGRKMWLLVMGTPSQNILIYLRSRCYTQSLDMSLGSESFWTSMIPSVEWQLWYLPVKPLSILNEIMSLNP